MKDSPESPRAAAREEESHGPKASACTTHKTGHGPLACLGLSALLVLPFLRSNPVYFSLKKLCQYPDIDLDSCQSATELSLGLSFTESLRVKLTVCRLSNKTQWWPCP